MRVLLHFFEVSVATDIVLHLDIVVVDLFDVSNDELCDDGVSHFSGHFLRVLEAVFAVVSEMSRKAAAVSFALYCCVYGLGCADLL